MTYVENEDDPARIWTILHDRFCATNDVTLCQAVTYIVTLCMADDGEIEAHIRDFTAGKRRGEGHSVSLTDIIYCTFFIPFRASDVPDDGYGDRVPGRRDTGGNTEPFVGGMAEAQRSIQRWRI